MYKGSVVVVEGGRNTNGGNDVAVVVGVVDVSGEVVSLVVSVAACLCVGSGSFGKQEWPPGSFMHSWSSPQSSGDSIHSLMSSQLSVAVFFLNPGGQVEVEVLSMHV